jgi:hypothetical protein
MRFFLDANRAFPVTTIYSFYSATTPSMERCWVELYLPYANFARKKRLFPCLYGQPAP